MSLNTKIRKRVSFTPIMLSSYLTIKPPNPFAQSIVRTINLCAINVRSQNYAKPETTFLTSSSDRVSISKGWILRVCTTRITVITSCCLPKGGPRMKATAKWCAKWPHLQSSKSNSNAKTLKTGIKSTKERKNCEKLKPIRTPKRTSKGCSTSRTPKPLRNSRKCQR